MDLESASVKRLFTDDDDAYSSPLHLLDIPMLLLLALEVISSRAGMRTM